MNTALKLGVVLLCALPAGRAQDIDRRVGTYRFRNSFEYGYRSAFVSGNREIYRSAVNYNNGFRLFSGLLKLNSGDGHGRFLDEIVLTTLGTGGDPYQANSLRLEKNRFFRLDMGFRIFNYYNHLPALSGGEHGMNSQRIFQNYDLVLLPQRKIQFLLGFDRNNQNGPAVTSENFDVRREPAFPRERFFVYAQNLRRVNDQYRAGFETTLAGMKVSFLQGLDYYKEDPQNFLDPSRTILGVRTSEGSPAAGIVPLDQRRSDPVHGRTPFTRLNLHTDANRRFSANGRFVYAGGVRKFVIDQNITGLTPGIVRQVFVLGSGLRSQGTGDLSFSYQPGQRWTLSNTTSINRTRITGDSAFIELRTPVSAVDPGRDEYFFDVLNLRLITNASDVDFRPTKTVGLHAGYHYSIRRMQSRGILEDIFGRPTDVPLNTFHNILHSGVAGVRVRPLPPFTMLLDVEYGRANQPFTPISEKRFHAETVKAQWKQKAWLITGSFKAYRNRNNAPPVLGLLEGLAPSSHNLESRQYSAGLAWTPARRYALDFSYAKVHLDTASGILNFPVPESPAVTSRRSLYISNLHHGHVMFRTDLHKNLGLFLGYSLVKDTAGAPTSASAPLVTASYPSFVFNGTDLINAYPLTYQSPQARVSLKLHPKLSWNIGWQYWGYSEKFTGVQNYHAHAGYTSLRWGF